MSECISGWVMKNKTPAVIRDISRDERIPQDVYRQTFVKSLLMVPMNANQPFGALGNYWSYEYEPTNLEIELLKTLADAASKAFENVRLYAEMDDKVKSRTKELTEKTAELEKRTKELEDYNEKLIHFQHLFNEREFRIKELKDRVKEFENRK